jgi:hypothetical protein
MYYHHRKKRRTRLKKHHRVLIFIAVVVFLYAFVWELGGTGWRGIWSRSHQHGWAEAPPPAGPSGPRR